jgi:diacylglycerol kinase (ATP)
LNDPGDHRLSSLSEETLRDEHLDSIPPVLSGGLLASFSAAFAGVARTVATQRNMKIHVLSALMVTIVGMALPLDLATRSALLFAVGVVFFAEILNTALEAFVDLHISNYHRLAMLAKDAAAAGVLVLAIVTVLIFSEILWSRWDLVTGNPEAVTRSVMFGVPLVLSEAVGLFWIRRSALAVGRFFVSAGLLFPLLAHSKDPIYGGLAVALVCLAAYARHAFPAFTGRGAPKKAD